MINEETPNKAIPAATILLLRDASAIEVLMIERHADIKFAGGAMVFPGGRLDPADSAPAWGEFCEGLEAFSEEELAPRIAAIREAFEETGILLARHRGESEFVDDAFAQSLNDLRKPVEDDGAEFLALVKRERLTLATDALRLFAQWMPPAVAKHRRFDTWFFAAATPPGQQAREDGNEATDAIWTTPDAVLKARDDGSRKMIFPTARNVELIGESKTVSDLLAATETRKIARVEPTFIERDGEQYVKIPDDLGYPVTEENLKTAFRS